MTTDNFQPVGEVKEKHLREDYYEYSIALTNGTINRTAFIRMQGKIPRDRHGAWFLGDWVDSMINRWKNKQ